MPQYQNTSVDSDRLIIGNWKIETAASAAATYVNMGAGQVTAFNHAIEKYDVEAGNAPDPIEGLSDETFVLSFELIEYDASVMTALMNGLIISSVATSLSTIEAGGATELTPRAYRLTNSRLNAGSTTIETILTLFSATIDQGFTWVSKSDNDADPINAIQFAVTAELDTTRTTGSQLFSLSHTETP